MVRKVDVNKKSKGGQANVFVVADSRDRKTLESVGRGCVKSFLKEQKAAFCQVWGQESDYEQRDPRSDGSLICWAFYIGVPLNGGSPIVTENDGFIYEFDKCPGKVRGS